MAVTTADLTKLYLAYFGRPPDFDGIQFYTAGDIERTRIVGASLGSESIQLADALRQMDRDVPAMYEPTGRQRRARRRGPSPAHRLLEMQRKRRLA
jgi:hypothetical protein